jgi:Dickkopf N-terminal cysteine-rich region
MGMVCEARRRSPFGLASTFTRGDFMKPSSFVALVFVPCVLLAGCSEPCVNDEPPVGEQCGTSFCSQAGYCATDAGPPTCVPKKVPGTPCQRDAECSGGTCAVDGGCGADVGRGPSGQCG